MWADGILLFPGVLQFWPEKGEQSFQAGGKRNQREAVKSLPRDRELEVVDLDNAREWIAAVRTALEQRGITKEQAKELTLRSDNGSQPCSKAFVEYLGSIRVKGQYTGYDAPDDNAFVERVIRTIKEEEIWPNLYDTVSEAREAIEAYMRYYNQERLHSALEYRTPCEVAADHFTQSAA